jgi:AcrR family transcriptional regulator
MPRIAAPSVQEHVARQEAAVVAAAIRLFNERGVHDVSVADIAAEVGLARNSLYRYFPDKAHILAAWFRHTITPLIEESAAIAAEDGPVADRLERWVDAHLAYLTNPEHASLLGAWGETSNLPDDVRSELGEGHQRLYAALGRILADITTPERDLEVVALLVAAVVRSGAEQVRSGADPGVVAEEVRRAARAIAGVAGAPAVRSGRRAGTSSPRPAS